MRKSWIAAVFIVVVVSAVLCIPRAGDGTGQKVARVWHGKVHANQAEKYSKYLYEEGIKKIRAIDGNLGVQVLRRTDGEVTEFYVISYWGSLEAIKKFAGDDIEKTHFLPKDSQYLIDPEDHVKHFELIVDEGH
jgi:heme-degrading monooxygenase HmoA